MVLPSGERIVTTFLLRALSSSDNFLESVEYLEVFV